MRPSALPRGALRRVCDACKQHHGYASAKSFSHAAAVAIVAPNRHATGLRSSKHRSRSVTNTRSIGLQTRRISSSAAAKPHEATQTDAGIEAEVNDAEPDAKQLKTHYDLFPQTLPLGPPPRGPFKIDVRELRREFLTLQATAHPDLAPAGVAKRRAEAASARINEAYRTLAHSLQRAQYLLWLRGIDAANEETAKVEDPELLMLVLETRETIEEAGSEEELEPLRAENEIRIKESEDVLAEAFASDDVETARAEVTRLRYWENIRESIQNWERGKPVVLQH